MYMFRVYVCMYVCDCRYNKQKMESSLQQKSAGNGSVSTQQDDTEHKSIDGTNGFRSAGANGKGMQRV